MRLTDLIDQLTTVLSKKGDMEVEFVATYTEYRDREDEIGRDVELDRTDIELHVAGLKNSPYLKIELIR